MLSSHFNGNVPTKYSTKEVTWAQFKRYLWLLGIEAIKSCEIWSNNLAVNG